MKMASAWPIRSRSFGSSESSRSEKTMVAAEFSEQRARISSFTFWAQASVVLARRIRKSPPFVRSHKNFSAGSCFPPPMRANPARGVTVLSVVFPARKYFHFAEAPGASRNIANHRNTLPRIRRVAMRLENTLAERAYQILQTCSRTMASPFLQPKALANSAIFESGPLPRKRASG
jgi:hypothetical protein